MESPLADWNRSLDERRLVPSIDGLAHPGRDADEVLRNSLVLLGALRFTEALRASRETVGQDTARERLAEMCALLEASIERLAERIRRNDAQRNAICAKISALTKLADSKRGWIVAMHNFGLHRPLSREVISMCKAAEIGVSPEFYERNLLGAAEGALCWLRERF